MSLYASDYPRDVQFDAEFKAFFENFYKLSDTPGANEEYAAQFTENATLIMASNKVVGRDGTLDLSCCCPQQLST